MNQCSQNLTIITAKTRGSAKNTQSGRCRVAAAGHKIGAQHPLRTGLLAKCILGQVTCAPLLETHCLRRRDDLHVFFWRIWRLSISESSQQLAFCVADVVCGKACIVADSNHMTAQFAYEHVRAASAQLVAMRRRCIDDNKDATMKQKQQQQNKNDEEAEQNKTHPLCSFLVPCAPASCNRHSSPSPHRMRTTFPRTSLREHSKLSPR